MNALDLDVLQHARDWLASGRRVHLVTVVQTWGSAPRQAGAMLAVRDDGQVVGSVSGGCIEDDLIDQIRQRGIAALCPGARPALATYG
ncbi:XdhC family protein, partial [Bordetella pertussis]